MAYTGKRYEILECDSSVELEERASLLIEKGWLPAGGLIMRWVGGDDVDMGYMLYIQALYLPLES